MMLLIEKLLITTAALLDKKLCAHSCGTQVWPGSAGPVTSRACFSATNAVGSIEQYSHTQYLNTQGIMKQAALLKSLHF